MKPQHVTISSPDPAGHSAKVHVDGVEQVSLFKIELTMAVDSVNVLVLHRIGPAVDFDGLARVVNVPPTLLERCRGALLRIENTPGLRRIPVDPTDPDVVLSDVIEVLELAAKAGAK